MTDSPIDKEVAFFETKRAELLASAEGKFALVKGEAIIGTYDSREDALEAGYARFGGDPFLVKQIAKEDEVVYFSSMLAFP